MSSSFSDWNNRGGRRLLGLHLCFLFMPGLLSCFSSSLFLFSFYGCFLQSVSKVWYRSCAQIRVLNLQWLVWKDWLEHLHLPVLHLRPPLSVLSACHWQIQVTTGGIWATATCSKCTSPSPLWFSWLSLPSPSSAVPQSPSVPLHLSVPFQQYCHIVLQWSSEATWLPAL